jgi:hypothetical protein
LTITGWGFTDASGVQFTLSDGKGIKVKASRLTIDGDTQIELQEPWLTGLRLWFNSGERKPQSSYTTDVQVAAGDFVSPLNPPEDQATFNRS